MEDNTVHTDMRKLPLMKKCCKTCPFKLNENNVYQDMSLAMEVSKRTLFDSQQICHGTETYDKAGNREHHNRCIGSFNHNAEIYKRIGLDPEKLR